MATKLHPGPTVGLRHSTPALNATLTTTTRGTTAWRAAAEDTGLLSATTWDPRSYGRYSFPHATWTAEIRFPIRATPGYATKGGG